MLATFFICSFFFCLFKLAVLCVDLLLSCLIQEDLALSFLLF
ncbi:putative membrane protein [Synechococcus sp. RS9907]|nr:putative membrane protein [Synechococcus sp. RS9907]